jgi:small-conductance mechanosensitive channel
MSKRALEGLAQFGEVNLFLRGIVPMIGYRAEIVEYERGERFAGESKYPLKKMIKFATDAIMSFSYKPLKIATFFGSFVSVFSFIGLIVMIILKLCGIGEYVDGWTSLAVISLFLNGIVLMILGIIGEYIGRIYDEAKDRPLYVIREVVNFTEENVK